MKNTSTVIWIAIIILLAVFMFWAFYREFKIEKEYQEHRKKEQTQSH